MDFVIVVSKEKIFLVLANQKHKMLMAAMFVAHEDKNRWLKCELQPGRRTGGEQRTQSDDKTSLGLYLGLIKIVTKHTFLRLLFLGTITVKGKEIRLPKIQYMKNPLIISSRQYFTLLNNFPLWLLLIIHSVICYNGTLLLYFGPYVWV